MTLNNDLKNILHLVFYMAGSMQSFIDLAQVKDKTQALLKNPRKLAKCPAPLISNLNEIYMNDK